MLAYPRIGVFGKMVYRSITVSHTGIRIRVTQCMVQNIFILGFTTKGPE
jgi:hypothetical protein